MEIPKFNDRSHLAERWSSELGFRSRPPSHIWQSEDMTWQVMVWSEGGWKKVGIRHGVGQEAWEISVTWSFLQGIKEQIFPGRTAIEVYPNEERVINQAPMRWLMVAPAGFVLPQTLGTTKPFIC